jgi:hypothetical protein
MLIKISLKSIKTEPLIAGKVARTIEARVLGLLQQ